MQAVEPAEPAYRSRRRRSSKSMPSTKCGRTPPTHVRPENSRPAHRLRHRLPSGKRSAPRGQLVWLRDFISNTASTATNAAKASWVRSTRSIRRSTPVGHRIDPKHAASTTQLPMRGTSCSQRESGLLQRQGNPDGVPKHSAATRSSPATSQAETQSSATSVMPTRRDVLSGDEEKENVRVARFMQRSARARPDRGWARLAADGRQWHTLTLVGQPDRTLQSALDSTVPHTDLEASQRKECECAFCWSTTTSP